MTDKTEELARVAFEATQEPDMAHPMYPGGWEAMPQHHRDVWGRVVDAVVSAHLGRLTGLQLRARLLEFVAKHAEIQLDDEAVQLLDRVRNSAGFFSAERPVIHQVEKKQPELLFSEDGAWFYPDAGTQLGWMAVSPEETSYGIDLFSKDYHCELGGIVEALVPGAVEIRTTTNKGVYVGSEWRKVIAYRVKPFINMDGRYPTVTLDPQPSDEAMAARYRAWVGNTLRKESE